MIRDPDSGTGFQLSTLLDQLLWTSNSDSGPPVGSPAEEGSLHFGDLSFLSTVASSCQVNMTSLDSSG